MRNKRIKWLIGSLSIAGVVALVFMISINSYAQGEDQSTTDGVNIENVDEMPSADMDADKSLKDCSSECKTECSKECTPEECEEACTKGKDSFKECESKMGC